MERNPGLETAGKPPISFEPMRNYFTMAALLLLFSEVSAQQNLFNIPSADITPHGKIFYQHQFNFYKIDELESKSHIVYGLGRGWDTGLNFVDLPVQIGAKEIFSYNDSSSRKPLYPLLMASLQKQWDLTPQVQANVGTQVGTNVSNDPANMKMAYFNYGVLRWGPDKKVHLLAGLYHTNDVYVGGPPDQQTGFMVGYEYKITKKLLLMGDFISGNNKKSQTVLGGGYTFGNRLQLFLGALLAAPNKQLQNGMVLEINWYGWDFMKE